MLFSGWVPSKSVVSHYLYIAHRIHGTGILTCMKTVKVGNHIHIMHGLWVADTSNLTCLECTAVCARCYKIEGDSIHATVFWLVLQCLAFSRVAIFLCRCIVEYS